MDLSVHPVLELKKWPLERLLVSHESASSITHSAIAAQTFGTSSHNSGKVDDIIFANQNVQSVQFCTAPCEVHVVPVRRSRKIRVTRAFLVRKEALNACLKYILKC